MSELYVFPLTHLTRGAGASRRVIIQGFDIPMRSLIIFGLGLAPCAILALVLWPLLGMWALFALPAGEVCVFVFVEGRSTKGMKLRNYQALWDRRKAAIDQFFCCGEQMHPGVGLKTTLMSNTVPVSKPDRSEALESLVDLNFAEAAVLGTRAAPARRSRHARKMDTTDPWMSGTTSLPVAGRINSDGWD